MHSINCRYACTLLCYYYASFVTRRLSAKEILQLCLRVASVFLFTIPPHFLPFFIDSPSSSSSFSFSLSLDPFLFSIRLENINNSNANREEVTAAATSSTAPDSDRSRWKEGALRLRSCPSRLINNVVKGGKGRDRFHCILLFLLPFQSQCVCWCCAR